MAGPACGTPNIEVIPDPEIDVTAPPDAGPQTAVLAGGCFWCTEAVFEQLNGVTEVISGYAGGQEADADYPTVSSGTSDHAESIRITYDPARVSYGQLLKVFFAIAHNPTQLNRQGPDTGRQYRSTIFYQDQQQRDVAQSYIHQLDQARIFEHPIVTTLEPLDGFYTAEQYHQDFVRLHPEHPYVRHHALPKVHQLHKVFPKQAKQNPEP